MSTYSIDENGYYGEFGGAIVPPALKKVIDELKAAYLAAIADKKFLDEYAYYLKDYVGRPSPLYKSEGLSEKYGTTILLKREDLNHTGSHKINNTIGQILLAKRMGKTEVIAETGAGQHGVATATVCALMKIPCKVFMGEFDIARQLPNVEKMKMLGAEVVSVTAGTRTLKEAVDEAINYWVQNPHTFYLLGSAVGPDPYPQMVEFFQSVISREIKAQMKEKYGKETPDCVIACVGGGSNAAGAFHHFLNDTEVKLIAAEAAGLGVDSGKTAATLHVGKVGEIHGYKTVVMQTPEGEIMEPYSISAGLDYPGVGPLHAHLAKLGRLDVEAVTDDEALAAAFLLTRMDGIIPAIESSHALAVLERRKFKPTDIVVVNISGRGDKDMEAYLRAYKA